MRKYKYIPGSDINALEDYVETITKQLNVRYGWLYSFTNTMKILPQDMDDNGRYVYRDVIVRFECKQEHDNRLNTSFKLKFRLETTESDGYEEFNPTDVYIEEPFLGEWYETWEPENLYGDIWFHAMNQLVHNL